MICALSPAAVNYEETLGTLRYAERAKKIVNKAIVNESVQEKIIRDLKEENERLKALLSKDGRLSAEMDPEEIAALMKEKQA